MAARGGRNNLVAKRVIDDLIDISRERSPLKYLKIFIEQQITDHRRFIARMRDEIRTSTNLISQLNVLIAELEASVDYEEVFDLVMELRDDRRDEEYGKPDGIKLNVTFDALNRISGKHRALFLSFLGDMVRQHIGLKILSWKKRYFDVVLTVRKLVMNRLSQLLRNFRRKLRQTYILPNQNTLSKLNEVLTKYSAILKAEEWFNFVKYTATKEYKVKSAAAKMARSKSVYQHTMGRVRYALVKEKMVSLVDINLINSNADEEGKTTVVGCENDLSIQKSNGLANLEKMETRVSNKTSPCKTVKSVGSKKMTRSIRKDSSRQDSQSQENVSPLLVLPQAIKCKLWHFKKSTIIALGIVYKTGGKQMLLPKDCNKVSIDTSLVDAACIPNVGNNDFKTVKDAVGGFFAWPKDQVVFDPKDRKKPSPAWSYPKGKCRKSLGGLQDWSAEGKIGSTKEDTGLTNKETKEETRLTIGTGCSLTKLPKEILALEPHLNLQPLRPLQLPPKKENQDKYCHVCETPRWIWKLSKRRGKTIGKIKLEVVFGDRGLLRTVMINFIVVRAPSPYNVIFGKTDLRSLRAVSSTIHYMVREVANGRTRGQPEHQPRERSPGESGFDRTNISQPSILGSTGNNMGKLIGAMINMKLNPKKCSFEVEEGKFLGYMVTSEGIRANPKKTKAIVDMQSHQTLREMQSLSGKLAALKRFLSHGNGGCECHTTSRKKGDIMFDTLRKQDGKRGRKELCLVGKTGPVVLPNKDDMERWTLFTDGASNSKGFRAGLVLISSNGVEFTYALRLNFANTNNEAEYEALLVGLCMAKKMKVQNIDEKVDSKLVVSQANYVIREIHMGSCGMHIRARFMVANPIIKGYYWPTMHRDVRNVT
nr:hypothetical protein [Tanacetum cinerariifolium]